MWELKAIEVGSKKIDAQVNMSSSNIHIEIPYYKSFKKTDIIKIDKKTYSISTAINVGSRDETISIVTNGDENNEQSKQDSSRKKD
tara:strand:- start:179 stop:436 length:258 start_codon:yes stop_codon:yes gene_type:complete